MHRLENQIRRVLGLFPDPKGNMIWIIGSDCAARDNKYRMLTVVKFWEH